jgi:hypothetical protein
MHATACLAAKNNCLAAKNKCLAESNRTRTESKATNKCLHPLQVLPLHRTVRILAHEPSGGLDGPSQWGVRQRAHWRRPNLALTGRGFYRSSTNSRSADRFPFSSVSLFGAAIFWTSLNPAALRRDEQAFDDR